MTTPIKGSDGRKFLWLFLAIALSSAITLRAQQTLPVGLFEGQPVIAVDLIARPTVDAESFRHLVTQAAGQPYSSQKIEDSVAALKATGQFTDVRTNVLPEGEGIRVEFIMEPAFYVGIFDFPGALGAFNYPQLLNVVRYPLDEPFDMKRVKDAAPALQRFFANNGYFMADVQADTRTDEAAQLVTVNYLVTLGKRARLGAIDLGGATPELTARLQNSLHSIGARLHGAILKSGKPYDAEHIRAAQRFLQNYLGSHDYLSSQIKLEIGEYDSKTNRVPVHFDVTPGPKVAIGVTGAHVSKRTLCSQVPIYQENTVDQDLVNTGGRNLTSYFQSKGYFDAQVTSMLGSNSDGTTNLTYSIDRGPRPRVAGVSVTGNRKFDQSQLKDQILVKKGSLLSRGTFSEDLVRKTTANLKAYYQNAGYEDVSVTSRVTNRQSDVYVIFQVTEGTVTVVDSVRTNGNETQNVSALVPNGLTIKPGEPYSAFRATQDRNKILAAYLNLGYLNATLRTEVAPVSGDKHRVVVTYQIDEGPRVHVAQVEYVGQRHTRVSLLAKTTAIQPGKDLSESKLLEGESNLYNLSIFDWANVAPRRPITDQKEEDVLARVHEAKRNSISYGVGFESTPRSGSLSTGTLILPGLPTIGLPKNFTIIEKTIISPLGSISYSRLNMRGLGETASISGLVSSLDQKGTITYSSPHFYGTNWSSLFSTSAERTIQNPLFAAAVAQGSFQLERPLDPGKTRRIQLRYTFQYVALNHLLIQNFVPTEDLNTRLSTLSATFLRDSRDKPLDAHRGVFQTFDVQVSPKVLGSSDNVARLFAQTAIYHQFTPWLVFANNLRLGLITAFPGSHVPFSQRFFSGGADSLRGFPLNGAGPQAIALLCTSESDPTTCTAKVSVPTGGQQLFIFNSEARFPIPIIKGLGGVLFYDGGNVYPYISLKGLVQNYSNSVGVGLRYQTPVGPVRIDFGHSLNPVPGLSSVQIFVTLGQAF